jgi:ferredoxin-NADP reductase
VSPKFKLSLVFKKKTELGPGLYDFMFTGAERLSFTPGQYLEWTLGTEHADSRGNRRTFSIASAPNEDEIHIAIRVPEHTSKFKTALLALEPGKIITAGQLSGDFVLPKDFKQKVTLIAGGIGITPYVSMAQTMVKLKEHRDITLFYMITTPQDFCYQDLWAKAAEFGLKVVPVLGDASAPGAVAWTGLTGRLNEGVLKTSDSDYQKRRYYISGPPGLVDAYRRLLRSLSVSPRNIVTDHFSGY